MRVVGQLARRTGREGRRARVESGESEKRARTDAPAPARAGREACRAGPQESATQMSERVPVIGLMLGDVTGIGPEISAKLLASGAAERHGARVAVIGDARVLKLGARDAGVEVKWRAYETVSS